MENYAFIYLLRAFNYGKVCTLLPIQLGNETKNKGRLAGLHWNFLYFPNAIISLFLKEEERELTGELGD